MQIEVGCPCDPGGLANLRPEQVASTGPFLAVSQEEEQGHQRLMVVAASAHIAGAM